MLPGGAGKKTDGSGRGLRRPEPDSLWNAPNALVISGVTYPIQTDFRVGITYGLLAEKGTLTEEDFYQLWFPQSRPKQLEEALEAVGQFYNLGQTGDGAEGPIPYDLGQDAAAIYAAFYEHYGLDLSRAELHWWHFRALLEGLFTHSFAQRVGYRLADLRGKTPEVRAEILKYRRIYEIGPREDLAGHLRHLEIPTEERK